MKYLIGAIVAVIVVSSGWYLLQGMKAAPAGETGATTPPPAGESASGESATQTTTTSTTTTTTVTPGTGVSASTSVGAVKEIQVDGSNFAFMPKEIRVKEGTRVKVLFRNTGGTHDFVIDEFSARTSVIKGGESQVVEFVANKKGTFQYYCSVGIHRQMGMVGNLIVE